MNPLEIPLIDNVFGLEITVRKIGSAIKNPVKFNAIIDTGAGKTCLCGSIISALNLKPSGPDQVAQTASGPAFQRPYPVNIFLGKNHSTSLPAAILFRPTRYLMVQVPRSHLTPPEVDEIIRSSSVQIPNTFATLYHLIENQIFMEVIAAGEPIQQSVVLIGMDILSKYNWSFDSKRASLVID